MNDETVNRVHWSFWAIGAVGLVFNLMGCMNYLSQMDAETVAAMPDVYRTIVESRPAWGTGAFAIAVFGGVLGCILLLSQKSIAIPVLVASLLGALTAQLPFVGMAAFPTEAWIGWFSQLAVGALLLWYSLRARGKGWIA